MSGHYPTKAEQSQEMSRLRVYHLEYRQTHSKGQEIPSVEMYRSLEVVKCDDLLGISLRINEDDLACLFRESFGTIVDNFLKSLTWYNVAWYC